MAFSAETKRHLRKIFQANALKLQQVQETYPHGLYVGWTGLSLLDEVIKWATDNLPKDAFWTDIDWDGTVELRVKTEEQLMLCKLRWGGSGTP